MKKFSLMLVILSIVVLCITSCSMIGVKKDEFCRQYLYNPDKAVVVVNIAYVWENQSLKGDPIDSVFRDEVIDIIDSKRIRKHNSFYCIYEVRLEIINNIYGYMKCGDLKRIRLWDIFSTYKLKENEGWFKTIDSLNIYERPWSDSKVIRKLGHEVRLKLIGAISYDYLVNGERLHRLYIRARVENEDTFGWVVSTETSLRNKIAYTE